jgi:hypothetical protein
MLNVTRQLTDVLGGAVPIPDRDKLVHLQFRRFAGCPVCNLHLRSFAARHAEIVSAGIKEVVVFHSSAEELREHVADFPFAFIPDPGKRLYREFGVEAGKKALLNPRVWMPVLRATVATIVDRDRPPRLRPAGGRWGLPADFLIAPTGEIVASKYGEHAYDQWTVDELLAAAHDHS